MRITLDIGTDLLDYLVREGVCEEPTRESAALCLQRKLQSLLNDTREFFVLFGVTKNPRVIGAAIARMHDHMTATERSSNIQIVKDKDNDTLAMMVAMLRSCPHSTVTVESEEMKNQFPLDVRHRVSVGRIPNTGEYE